MSTIPREPSEAKGASDGKSDTRSALFNEGADGPAPEIQRTAEEITRLLGFVADLDPGLLIPGNPIFPPDADPRRFHERIRPALDRHPIYRDAEVRSSGTGIHLIVRFAPPIELATAADQAYWANLVLAVQRSLPTDPNAPGVTGLTRPVGSVNSKNGAVVETLRPGRPIDPIRVVEFVAAMGEAPFRTVAMVLLGADRPAPCPICRAPGSSLGVLDRVGKCYGCGKVNLEGLYGAVMRPEPVEASDPSTVADSPR